MQKSVDIRRNDQVQVITGRDKGKQGRVLRVMQIRASPGGARHDGEEERGPNPQKNIKGGIAEQESAISLSNVMLRCNSCNRPVRVGHEHRGDRMCGCARVAAIRWRSRTSSWHLAFSASAQTAHIEAFANG